MPARTEGPEGGGRRWAGARELGVERPARELARILGAVLGRMVAEEGLWRRPHGKPPTRGRSNAARARLRPAQQSRMTVLDSPRGGGRGGGRGGRPLLKLAAAGGRALGEAPRATPPPICTWAVPSPARGVARRLPRPSGPGARASPKPRPSGSPQLALAPGWPVWRVSGGDGGLQGARRAWRPAER